MAYSLFTNHRRRFCGEQLKNKSDIKVSHRKYLNFNFVLNKPEVVIIIIINKDNRNVCLLNRTVALLRYKFSYFSFQGNSKLVNLDPLSLPLCPLFFNYSVFFVTKFQCDEVLEIRQVLFPNYFLPRSLLSPFWRFVYIISFS